MFKSVTIEPRPNNERYHWEVKFRLNDTADHIASYETLEAAFVDAQAWLLHSKVHWNYAEDEQERTGRGNELLKNLGVIPVKED